MPYADPAAQREYQRQWLAARRAKWFEGKSCIDCGAVDDLELDHRDPAQKVSHRIWSWSWERIEAEAAKCDVRCRDCHLDKSKREGDLSHCITVPLDVVETARTMYAAGGVTQQQVADALGISRRNVSYYVNGHRRQFV